MDLRDIREHDSFPRAPEDLSHEPHALGVITAIVVVAGFAMVAAWFALLLLDDRRTAPLHRAAAASCTICGVVERVSEIQPAPMQALEGSRAEGTVVLLAALGGARAPGGLRAKLYETSVLHDDGTVRVLREAGAPLWKAGDRVKVVRGRVEPDALTAGRKSIPAPQAARGW